MKNTAQPKRGFTLIELLIVISIIAVLAAVGAVVYSTAQKNGRISKRVQDLRAVESALEVFKTSNGYYPCTHTDGSCQLGAPGPTSGTTVNNGRSQCSGWGSNTQDQVVPGFVPKYMPAFPTDSSFTTGSNANCYLLYSDGMDYKLEVANNTDMTTSDLSKQPSLIDPKWSGASTNPCTGGTTTGGPTAWSIYTTNGVVQQGGTGAQCW